MELVQKGESIKTHVQIDKIHGLAFWSVIRNHKFSIFIYQNKNILQIWDEVQEICVGGI
jgi:hypothetical protein